MAGSDQHDLQALSDLRTPWCIRTVVTLGIPRNIADGMTDLNSLAEKAQCDAGALHAVLAHLVASGLFTEPTPGTFGLTDLGAGLLDPPPDLDLTGIGGRISYAWGTLPTFVRTGKPGYHQHFGKPFWDDLAAHPDIATSFDDFMGLVGHGVPDPHLPIDWDPVRTVVDVGGGTGAMLAEILRAYPAVRGTLVDLPGTVARAGPVFDAAGVADRISLVGQSFFDPLPTGADVYLLNRVLNDWPDAQTSAILSRCAAAAGPFGRIVVVGGVTPDDTPVRLEIDMVLVGGRTDSLTEFRERAASAGLMVAAARSYANGRFVVECRSQVS
ncbi:MAG TPA: methyltransferase [Mycobacteriales bacterium]|jgi:hypothetical protein|nr:methyltransferase [Mycobacteriales bacterium]